MGKKSVFISYSSKDSVEVQKVIEVLESANISYWKAPEMIPIGSNYAKEIPRVISECTVFLLIISKSSQKSIWVEKELDFAINNRKTIVPLKIDDSPLLDIFTFYLNNVQTIFYSDNVTKAMQLLKDRILVLTGVAEMEEKAKKEALQASMNQNKLKAKEEADITYRVQPTEPSSKLEHRRKRTVEGAFGMNPQPYACKYCNGKLKLVSKGVYECLNCHKENYDYFQTIRNFLSKAGPSSRMAIEKATGIPRESIDYFIQQDKLEVVKEPGKKS